MEEKGRKREKKDDQPNKSKKSRLTDENADLNNNDEGNEEEGGNEQGGNEQGGNERGGNEERRDNQKNNRVKVITFFQIIIN